MNQPRWDLRQKLSLRVSTMLLLYFPLLIVLAFIFHDRQNALALTIMLWLGASVYAMHGIMLLACIFGLAFFIASLLAKQPQFQYLLEPMIAVAFLIFLPVF